jgi:hypothetical protein
MRPFGQERSRQGANWWLAGREGQAKGGASMEHVSPKGDPERIARRYYKTAAEYVGLARGASSPSLRAYFARIAEEYIVRADGEVRIAERRQVGAQ